MFPQNYSFFDLKLLINISYFSYHDLLIYALFDSFVKLILKRFMNLRSVDQVENSKIKISSINEFILACIRLGEEDVIQLLRKAQETQIEQIKVYIIDHVTSKFDLSNNFMRSKRIKYFNRHQNICFATILFQFRKYFSWSYNYICKEILKIREKNDISYYLGILNKLKDTDDDKYYIKLVSDIDSDIKNFVEKTIKNNHND
jgi:hypothetical protein